MKNLILIFLLIPIIGFAQNKKELKKRIVQKNDSIIVFINQIDQLNNKVETLENENAAFEGDIRKLLKKVSNEQEKNKGLNHNFMGGNHFHPEEYRIYTLREAQRIMSLPDDYKHTGSLEDSQARIGLMVAPLCLYYLVKSINEKVLEPYGNK